MSNDSFTNGEDVSAIILDLGSHTIKAGYGGLFDRPQFEIPTIIGNFEDEKSKKFYVGDVRLAAIPESAFCAQFIENGQVTNWDHFEAFFEYFTKEMMKINPSDIPFLFIEHPVFDEKRREKLAEILFEKFNICATAILPNSPLVLLSKDKTTGGVIDVGASHATVSCVYNLHILRSTTQTSKLGGDYLVERIDDLLTSKNVQINIPPGKNSEFDFFRRKKILEDLATKIFEFDPYPVGRKISKRQPAVTNMEYSFGQKVVDFSPEERCTIPEAFFDPSLLDFGETEGIVGLQDLIQNSLDAVDVDYRIRCARNFLTTGGVSEMPGFVDKISYLKMNPRLHFMVNAYTGSHREPRFDAWKGASILVGTGSFQQLWVSKNQFLDSTKKDALFYF